MADSSAMPSTPGMALPRGVVANAVYERRVPEPPSIAIQLPLYNRNSSRPRSLEPARPVPDPRPRFTRNRNSTVAIPPNPAMATAIGLTSAQVQQITGNRPIEAPTDDIGGKWKYEMRYQAQCILEYLYLGPSTATRKPQFLAEAGITMLLVVRDTRLAMAQLLDMSQMVRDPGLALHSLDVTSPVEFIQALPTAAKAINDHMLGAPRDNNGVSTGRVLILCETGNERSAIVVVAYIMAMYGLRLADALAFVNYKRFSMSLDEDSKNMLQTYGDMLLAQSDVARQTPMEDGPQKRHEHLTSVSGKDEPQTGGSAALSRDASRSSSPGLLPNANSWVRRPKRRIEDTMEMAESSVECSGGSPTSSTTITNGDQCLDMERFQNRGAFVPFADTDVA